MHKCVLVLCFISSFIDTYSQVIRVEAGKSVSSIKDKKRNYFGDKSIKSYTFSISIDYYKHKYFYLSSQISYLKKGGIDFVEVYSYGKKIADQISLKIDYFQLNTTLNLTYPLGNIHFYAGVGPKLDFPLKSKLSLPWKYIEKGDHCKTRYSDIYKISPGIKTITGAFYNFERIQLGLNYSFIWDFFKYNKDDQYPFKHSNTQSFNLSVGYIFQKENQK